jgi:hypothetical protein
VLGRRDAGVMNDPGSRESHGEAAAKYGEAEARECDFLREW